MSTTASVILLLGRIFFVALFVVSAQGNIVNHQRYVHRDSLVGRHRSGTIQALKSSDELAGRARKRRATLACALGSGSRRCQIAEPYLLR
jgi:hypothetical protein